jgi:uncharacterized membrane protein YfcA
VTLVAILLALLVGASLGMLGGGGAVLTVPVFVYMLGVPRESAVPMSFLIIGSASAIGALQRWHAKEIRPAHGLMYGAAAVAGAFLGARLGVRIDIRIRMAVFGVAVISAAVSMLRSASQPGVIRPAKHPAVAVPVFFAIGVLTSIIGVGGGFLFVPALVALAGVPMREATGLSLMIIAMNAMSALAGYTGQVHINFRLSLLFTAAVVLGMLPAGRYASRLPVHVLKRGFAVLLLAVGGYVLFDNLL